MPDLLIRNLAPETLAFLKERAASHGRSLQSEVKTLIEDAESRARRNDEFWEIARRSRERLAGRIHSDSADLIREDRDTDHGRDA